MGCHDWPHLEGSDPTYLDCPHNGCMGCGHCSSCCPACRELDAALAASRKPGVSMVYSTQRPPRGIKGGRETKPYGSANPSPEYEEAKE